MSFLLEEFLLLGLLTHRPVKHQEYAAPNATRTGNATIISSASETVGATSNGTTSSRKCRLNIIPSG